MDGSNHQSSPLAEMTAVEFEQLLAAAEAALGQKSAPPQKPQRLMSDEEYEYLFRCLHEVRFWYALNYVSAAFLIYRHQAFGRDLLGGPVTMAKDDDLQIDDSDDEEELSGLARAIAVEDTLAELEVMGTIRRLLRETVARGHARVVSGPEELMTQYKPIINCGFGGQPEPMSDTEFDRTMKRVKAYIATLRQQDLEADARERGWKRKSSRHLSPDGFVSYKQLCGDGRPFAGGLDDIEEDEGTPVGGARALRHPELDRFIGECFDRDQLPAEFGAGIRAVRFSYVKSASTEEGEMPRAVRTGSTPHQTRGAWDRKEAEARMPKSEAAVRARVLELEGQLDRTQRDLTEAHESEAKQLRLLADAQADNRRLRDRIAELERQPRATVVATTSKEGDSAEVERLQRVIKEMLRELRS